MALLETVPQKVDGDMPRRFDGNFQTDFLSIEQMTVSDFWRLDVEADAMKWMAQEKGVYPLLEGSVYDLLFWESDSTRTKSSFIHAVERLGGTALPFDYDGSSKNKGETFERTTEMLDSYLIPGRDGLIIRHNQAGAVAEAAKLADVHVINAGDGANEHPTQANLDGKTVVNHVPDLSEAYIAYFGDLARARTVNSTAILLAKLGVERMAFVSPVEEMRPRHELIADLRGLGVATLETNDLRAVIQRVHGVYVSRTQYNLMPEGERDEARRRLQGAGLITPDMLEGSGAFLMHPLPEDNDDPNFHPDLRRDPRCIVKEQAANGQWTRMGFLALQAGKSMVPYAVERGWEVPARHRGRIDEILAV